MKRYTILLFLLLILVACAEDPITQIVTQQITTEPASTLVEPHESAGKLWLITDALEQRTELHGQVILIEGYVGWQGENGGTWIAHIWNEPIPTYEDIWRSARAKEPANELDKWKRCRKGAGCWVYGQDSGAIRYAHAPQTRSKELKELSEDLDPKLTYFVGNPSNNGEKPGTVLKHRDKYVLKVLVRDYTYDVGFTLLEVMNHTEMPPEQPPDSINANNPMPVKEFKTRYKEFYGQTVSVKGVVSGFSRNRHLGADFYSFGLIPNKDTRGEADLLKVLYPYNELVYKWKFQKQGLVQWKEVVVRIRVYRPENHTVRKSMWNNRTTQEEYPCVIQWVDQK